jgi:hypothetical protein
MTLNRLTLIGFVGADAGEKTNSKGSPYTLDLLLRKHRATRLHYLSKPAEIPRRPSART